MNPSDNGLKERVVAALVAEKFTSVYGGLKNPKPSGDGWMLACCPFHDDADPSFGFNPTTGQWKCFAGCGQGDVFNFLEKQQDLPFKEVLLGLSERLGMKEERNESTKATTYDYEDENGEFIFQVVRTPPKTFWQRRSDGKGGWINDRKGVVPTLYRLPQLLDRRDEPVYVVEGEKDADRLTSLGFVATTSPGGAGRWLQRYSQILAGRDVIILPDNDAPGRKYAIRVTKSLRGLANSVRILELPGLPDKGDVSDWLDAGGSPDQLDRLVAEAEPISDEVGENLEGVRPVIQVNDRQLLDLVNEATEAILLSNDPPYLFIKAGQIARPVMREFGPDIERLDETMVYGVLARTADWVKTFKTKTTNTSPPRAVAADIHVNPPGDLPVLETITTTPFFDASGRLISRPGYYPCPRALLVAVEGEKPITVPKRPTDAQVVSALALLRQDLLIDFPFEAESDEAHALAMILLPFVRLMIPGCIPIQLIEAHTPGTGKTLLAQIASLIALAYSGESTTVTQQEDETRKKITALLLRGRPIIRLDNVDGRLKSAQLASALTADVWSDRILGKTQEIDISNRAIWIVTGNNPELSMEIARRCIRIRISPEEERPWERQEFKHPDLIEWVKQHRRELVRAALTLIQSWVVAGQKRSSHTLGSFTEYAGIIGGILTHIGVGCFMEDMDEFYAEADSESKEWAAFVIAWHERFSGSSVGVKDLYQLACEEGMIPFAIAGKSEQAQKAKLGKMMNTVRGRRFGNFTIEMSLDRHTKVRMYRLRDVSDGSHPDGEMPF